MSGIILEFHCTTDCSHYKLLPKKERCKGCKNYGVRPIPDECHACKNCYPRCKYDEFGECTSSVSKVNKMVLEIQKLTGKKVRLT